MMNIQLRHGLVTIVDDIDFECLSNFKWTVYKANGGFYRVSTRLRINGKSKSLELPGAIMFPPNNMVVDHKNGNPLDNRRVNLRVCTHSENIRNQKVHKDHSIGIKGIYYNGKKWAVRGITIQGKSKYLGVFDCPLLAKLAYNKELIRLHGEFANFG